MYPSDSPPSHQKFLYFPTKLQHASLFYTNESNKFPKTVIQTPAIIPQTRMHQHVHQLSMSIQPTKKLNLLFSNIFPLDKRSRDIRCHPSGFEKFVLATTPGSIRLQRAKNRAHALESDLKFVPQKKKIRFVFLLVYPVFGCCV